MYAYIYIYIYMYTYVSTCIYICIMARLRAAVRLRPAAQLQLHDGAQAVDAEREAGEPVSLSSFLF